MNTKSTPRFLAVLLILIMPGFANAGQLYFESAELAANTLYKAIEDKDRSALEKLFGDDYELLLPIEAVSDEQRQAFSEAWKHSYELVENNKDQKFILVGENGWAFPVPLEKDEHGWSFDTRQGILEVRTRRIGRNELSAMQAVLAYYDAQFEYASADRDGDGTMEYAQKIKSSAGKKDGLYWPLKEGQELSPLGEYFAAETVDDAYHGYHYKILTAQGDSAPGGKQNYIKSGNMTGGFALLAWPADYGETGIISFMVSHHGKLYEKNLGLNSENAASETTEFNPADGWVESEEQP